MKTKKVLLIRKHYFDQKRIPYVLMFRILLFCCGFFFISPFNIKAQSYIPLIGEGKSWNCAFEMIDLQESYTIRLEGDTIINEVEHKRIIREMHFYDSIELIGFIREDTLGKVYSMNTSFEEGLIYDFGANQGDTIALHNTLLDWWDYECPWFDELTIVVDTVYTIESQDGITRRVSVVKRNDDNFSELWIEGIGSLAGLIKSGTNLFEELSCPSSFITNYLMCYFEDDSLVYSHSPYGQPHDCRFYDDTSVEKLTGNPTKIKILPNPVIGSFFQIESSEPFQGDIYIFNSLGKLVYRESVNSLETNYKVPIVSFKPGIYFLKLVSKNGEPINTNKIIINN